MSLVSNFKHTAHSPGISLHEALHGRDTQMVPIIPDKPNSDWLIPIACKTKMADAFVGNPFPDVMSSSNC